MEQVEPWGERRLDFLFARLITLVANIVRDEKKHREPYVPKDFMPEWNDVWDALLEAQAQKSGEEEDAELTEVVASKVMALNEWFGGAKIQ